MYLIMYYTFGSPDHFFPLVKGWVSGLNLLLDTLALINPIASVVDG